MYNLLLITGKHFKCNAYSLQTKCAKFYTYNSFILLLKKQLGKFCQNFEMYLVENV